MTVEPKDRRLDDDQGAGPEVQKLSRRARLTLAVLVLFADMERKGELD